MNKLLRKYGSQPIFYQFFRKMKLTILIVTVSILSCLSAETYSQTTKLTITENNSTLLNVLRAIESQSEFKFFYNEKVDVNKQVSVEVNQKSITEILDKVLSSTSIKYKVLGRQIALYDKNEMEPFISEQQGRKVTGKVTDSSGASLPGVSVVVKGTSTGVITDNSGNFTLTNIPENGKTITFSFIGMKPVTTDINGRDQINVVLETEIMGVDEVVVTALGIKKETKKIGYAAAIVKAEEMTVNRTTNFMQSLQGKVAGVNITSMATGAGGSTNINVRGQSSFSGSNQPLIVVDGIPISNSKDYGGTQGPNNSDAGDGLLSINPDIIESMTVLKGGAAAALYGSRAKDGVIMITTKNHKQNKGVEVTFNSNATFDRAIDDTNFQYEYGQGEKGVRPTKPFPDSGVWSFGEKIQPGMTQMLFNGEVVPYVAQKNHIKDFYNGGFTFTNTLSVASQGDKGGFNLSLAQLKNDGIMPHSGFDRYNASFGFTQDITSKLKVSGNLNYSREIHTNPPQIASQDMTSTKSIYTMSNTMPLSLMEKYQRDVNGNEIIWSRFKNRTNPYISANDAFNNIDKDRFYGNITARYNFTDLIYAQVRVGQDYYARHQDLNFPSKMAGQAPAPQGFVNGSVTQDQRRFREINSDFLIGAEKEFNNKIGINLTFGGNTMYQYSDQNSTLGQDFIVPWLYAINNARLKTPIYNYSERQVNSLYGTADFSYSNYLFINGTLRNDWFSTLSPATRSVIYPSVSGSFVFSQAFENMPAWLNFGKLRAGYSEVGSDTDIAPFSQTLTYGLNSNLFNGQPVGTINTGTIPNSGLRPMRVKEYEFGFNMKVFNRINLDLTYYHKLSIDQILNAAVSNASGYSSQLINVGESENKGLEMLLDLSAIKSHSFSWNIIFNGAYNTSKVLKLGLDDKAVSIGGTIRQVVGQPLGQIYTSGYLRDDQGRKIFNATNGLPLTTSQDIRMGCALPKWFGGVTNILRYKGISMSALVDFKLGNQIVSSAEFDFMRHGKSKATLIGREDGFVIGDGVKPDGTPNTTKVDLQTYYEATARINENNVYNAGFWKLRQLTIGYDLIRIKKVAELLKLQECNLNAVANNVLTIKRWTNNTDPEQVYQVDGTQDIALPLVRSYGFNLKIKF